MTCTALYCTNHLLAGPERAGLENGRQGDEGTVHAQQQQQQQRAHAGCPHLAWNVGSVSLMDANNNFTGNVAMHSKGSTRLVELLPSEECVFVS